MSHAANPCLPATAAASGRMSRRAALWLNASILVTYLAASTAPSPLYALYREAWGFSALTLTLVFSTYAFTLLAALLFFGALSDHRGRREVVIVAGCWRSRPSCCSGTPTPSPGSSPRAPCRAWPPASPPAR